MERPRVLGQLKEVPVSAKWEGGENEAGEVKGLA